MEKGQRTGKSRKVTEGELATASGKISSVDEWENIRSFAAKKRGEVVENRVATASRRKITSFVR